MMKNEDLLKLRVKIQVKNNLFFQEIALLVDKPEFLQMLPALRKDLGVSQLASLDKYMDEAYDKPFRSKKQGKINFLKYKDAVKLKKFAQEFDSIYAFGGIEKEMDLFQLIATEVNLVCIQFNRPPYFAEVVRQAIYCGKVHEVFFKPTSAEIIDNSNVFPTASYFKLPQVAIFVSPTSTYEDVKSALREANGLYNTDKRLIYYRPRIDTVNNIRKYRHWYWEHLPGKKSYATISSEWMDNPLAEENDPGSDENFVLKGIKTYQKLLKL